MNKINIFCKQHVSLSCVVWFGSVSFFSPSPPNLTLCPGCVKCVETPHRSIRMSVSLPKICIVTGHLWHRGAALTLDITVLPCDSQDSSASEGTVWIPSTLKMFAWCKCGDECESAMVILLNRTFSCHVNEMIWSSWFHSFLCSPSQPFSAIKGY